MRKASLLVLTWCAGTTLAVILALQGVALVDSQINDDRASVNPTGLLPSSATADAPEPDDSVAQIGAAITPDPTTGTTPGDPTTRANALGELIITAAPPPVTEPPTTEPAQNANANRPHATAAAPPATETTSAPAVAVETTAPPTTAAPTVPETQPATPTPADADEPDDDATTTRPRSNSRSSTPTTHATTTTRRNTTTTTTATTTTRDAPTSTRPASPPEEPSDPDQPSSPEVGSKTFLTPGGQISAENRGGKLTLVFARPRPEFTQTILGQRPDLIDVRFASDDHTYRIIVSPVGATEFASTNITER